MTLSLADHGPLRHRAKNSGADPALPNSHRFLGWTLLISALRRAHGWQGYPGAPYEGLRSVEVTATVGLPWFEGNTQ